MASEGDDEAEVNNPALKCQAIQVSSTWRVHLPRSILACRPNKDLFDLIFSVSRHIGYEIPCQNFEDSAWNITKTPAN